MSMRKPYICHIYMFLFNFLYVDIFYAIIINITWYYAYLLSHTSDLHSLWGGGGMLV